MFQTEGAAWAKAQRTEKAMSCGELENLVELHVHESGGCEEEDNDPGQRLNQDGGHGDGVRTL